MSDVEDGYRQAVKALEAFNAAMLRAMEAHDAQMRRFAKQIAQSMRQRPD